ncbi:DivIVA domain-containing protein [Mobiluncus holmesii]|uniref:DivIVA domain-containing protein n=2 Tax=Actinomycetaceae TaxID=2049 RepID=A0A7K0K678_9ACTO|nr:DivIVA domain-containing protein [Mobiluncus porci]
MSETMFRTAKFLGKGYARDEVEEFLTKARSAYEGTGGPANFGAAQVRAQGFNVVRGGYKFSEVDAAMDRLESAFVARARADHVAVNGQKAWMNLVAEQATTLYPRLLRPAGKRFSHPKGRERGYRVDDVDALLERLVAYFDENQPLTSREIRDAVFAESKGTRAYAEGPVDAYLARAVEVLLAVE